MGRLVKIVSTRDKTVTRLEDFEGTTFADLKRAHSFEGMAATVRETKVNLEHDDAQLPQEDFTVFLSPTKVKSGANPTSMSDSQLSELFSDLEELFDECASEYIEVNPSVITGVNTLKRELFVGGVSENAGAKISVRNISSEDLDLLAEAENF